MLVLNDAQAMIVENLLVKMLINDTYSVSQLEEAIGWFQREGDRVSCPFEQVWSKNLAQEIVQALQSSLTIANSFGVCSSLFSVTLLNLSQDILLKIRCEPTQIYAILAMILVCSESLL